MRILASNDDGIQHPSLQALARALQPLGEVVVSAPDRNRSGVGAGLTLHETVRVRETPFPVAGVRAYAVEGTPGDAVILGVRRLAGGPVDAVVTGINPGHNVSADLLVSGTVGGALQAYLNGVCALAVSTAVAEDAASPVVANVIRAIVFALPAEAMGRAMLVNMNFPRLADLVTDSPKDAGIKGAVQTVTSVREVEDQVEPDGAKGREYYWILRRAAGPAHTSPGPGTDIRAVRDGYVSITSLSWSLTPELPAPQTGRLVEAAESVIKHSRRASLKK